MWVDYRGSLSIVYNEISACVIILSTVWKEQRRNKNKQQGIQKQTTIFTLYPTYYSSYT